MKLRDRVRCWLEARHPRIMGLLLWIKSRIFRRCIHCSRKARPDLGWRCRPCWNYWEGEEEFN